MEDTGLIKGTLYTLIAAAGFGAIAPVAKILYSYGMTPVFMLAARFFIASIILWGYVFLKRDELHFRLEKEQLLVMFLIGGLLYFLTTSFYYDAIRYIPVSLHVMIFYTYPFMINIFAIVFLKEKISIRQVVALFTAFGGILLILTELKAEIHMIGIGLSVMAAVCNSAYVLALGLKKIEKVGAVVTSAYTNTFSAITFIGFCLIKDETNFHVNPKAWLGILFISLVSTAVAIIALSAGVKRIGAAKASIISTFEPIEGVLLSVIILGEQLHVNQIFGTVLVMTAIVAINMGYIRTKQERRLHEPKRHSHQTHES